MRWKITLNHVLKQHNQKSVDGKTASYATQNTRREILEKGFRELRTLGYKLPDVRGFKERHMTALGHAWEVHGLSASTIQNRISAFRTFSEWMGKKGMIRDAIHYVKNPQNVTRQFVAREDKTWSSKNQSLADKLNLIQEKSPFVAIQLELQRAFGLRMKEAALLKPHCADKGAYLAVHWGTKGGRERIIRIDSAYQKDVLARAKSLLSHRHASMTPKAYLFTQWHNHYYYVCKQHGITRKEGVTSHGLRHERLNEIYTEITGHLSPVKGGVLEGGLDRDLDRIARQEVSEVAGHSRSSIASAYLGSLF